MFVRLPLRLCVSEPQLTGDLEAHEATGAMVPLKGGPSQWVNRAETLFVQGTLGTAKKLGQGVGKALRITGTNDTADAAGGISSTLRATVDPLKSYLAPQPQ